MAPQKSAVAHLVQLRNADTVGIRFNMFGNDVHSYFAEIEVCSNTCRRRDSCRIKNIPDYFDRQFPGCHLIRPEIIRHIHHHFID